MNKLKLAGWSAPSPVFQGFQILNLRGDLFAKVGIVMIVSAVLLLVSTDPAAAQAINLNPVTQLLNSFVSALTGTLGKSIATLALIGVCISVFFGFIEMRTAFFVVVAIVFVGSAATIVNSLWSK